MSFVMPQIAPVLPEILVLSLACVVLVVDAYLPQERRRITYGLAQATLAVGLLTTLLTLAGGETVTFNGHFVRDLLGDVLKVAIFLAAGVGFLLSRDYLEARGLFRGEYYVLGVFGVLGMMVLVSAGSFLTVYLGLELLSLSLYAMVAIDRRSAVCSEAAMKYFVLGALASGMLLYGISMLYGATGSLDLRVVADALATRGLDDTVLAFGLAFVVVGIAFKLGAVPFHMWLPDVYQGALTPVTLFIGTAPKLAAFALVIRLLADGLAPLQQDWQQMLVVLAVLSIAAGNVIAIAQQNIKRMLAYSTIAHVGYLLLGIVAGTPAGYSAAMFYTVTYVLMAVGAFGMIILLSRQGFEADRLEDFKGLNDRSPWLAFIMMMLMFSMAGVPPLVGFYGKLAVFQAVIEAGLTWVAVIGVFFSIIGAFYYLRVVKFIYFDKPDDEVAPLEASLDARVAVSAVGLLVVLFGLYPTGLMALFNTALAG